MLAFELPKNQYRSVHNMETMNTIEITYKIRLDTSYEFL